MGRVFHANELSVQHGTHFLLEKVPRIKNLLRLFLTQPCLLNRPLAVVFCLRTIGNGSKVYFILTESDSARFPQNRVKNTWEIISQTSSGLKLGYSGLLCYFAQQKIPIVYL